MLCVGCLYSIKAPGERFPVPDGEPLMLNARARVSDTLLFAETLGSRNKMRRGVHRWSGGFSATLWLRLGPFVSRDAFTAPHGGANHLRKRGHLPPIWEKRLLLFPPSASGEFV
jgi:hypothetical protein